MKNQGKLTVPIVLEALNEISDKQETIKNENRLACMFASPVMFFAAAANFIIGYLINKGSLVTVLADSMIFIILAVLFEILLRIEQPLGFVTKSVAVLYSAWFLFILGRLFYMVGHAVWLIAIIQVIFTTSRLQKGMTMYLGGVTMLAGFWVMANPQHFVFQIQPYNYITQLVLFAVLLLVLAVVHRINNGRYNKLLRQLQLVQEQKNDIEALYEELSATDEELSLRNLELTVYAEEIKKNEEKLYDLAYYDTLTGLANRKMFMEQLDLIVDRAKSRGSEFYVVFIDLDLFKTINDTMGHYVGDLLMFSVASRLRETMQKGDIIGRIGGDEFALIINRAISKQEVACYIEGIRDGLMHSFKIENAEIRTTASFGISIFPLDGQNTVELLKSADLAMYKAKELGKNNVQFYEAYMQREMLQKIEIEKSLLEALKYNEFYLVFQPQFSVDGQKIRGFETLIRWDSPKLGLVSPDKFIPLAEEMGLIVPLGQWIIRTACHIFKRLQEEYNLDACISINISTVQIKDPSFIKLVKEVLAETGLNPSSLELEITESVFIGSFHQTIPLLEELKSLGVRITLDDFGTGYSSLSYLKLLPIDTLKIDQTFINDLSEHSPRVQIVGDIISLGHNLGITVIAEGVEYSHQRDYLQKHFCDFIQGYIFAKPMKEDMLRAMLEDRYSQAREEGQ